MLVTITILEADDKWYMNIEATSHMTAKEGNISSYFNMRNNVTVGSGQKVVDMHHYLIPLIL